MSATVEDVPIADVDSHVAEPVDLWTSRMPARLGDAIPRVVWDEAGGESRWKVGDVLLSAVGEYCSAGWPEHFPSHPPTLADADPACYDAKARLERLDTYGVWAQALYPNVIAFDAHAFLSELGPDDDDAPGLAGPRPSAPDGSLRRLRAVILLGGAVRPSRLSIARSTFGLSASRTPRTCLPEVTRRPVYSKTAMGQTARMLCMEGGTVSRSMSSWVAARNSPLRCTRSDAPQSACTLRAACSNAQVSSHTRRRLSATSPPSTVTAASSPSHSRRRWSVVLKDRCA